MPARFYNFIKYFVCSVSGQFKSVGMSGKGRSSGGRTETDAEKAQKKRKEAEQRISKQQRIELLGLARGPQVQTMTVWLMQPPVEGGQRNKQAHHLMGALHLNQSGITRRDAILAKGRML